MERISANTKGFSLLEAVIATALIGLFVAASTVGLAYGVRATKDAGRKQQAMYLAEEGLEVSRNIRDESFANLVNGTWGIAKSGGQWVFSGSTDVVDMFTRSVTIADAGLSQKHLTSTITWTDTAQRTQSLELTTYLSDWRSVTTTPWSTVALAGVLDVAGTENMYKVATSGDYTYMIRSVSGATNFFILDISSPSAPTIVSSLTLGGVPSNIVLSDQYAYITSSDNTGELQVVSIVDPALPVSVATYDASGDADANSLALLGTYVFFVRDQSPFSEVFVIDVANPLTPLLTGSLDVSDDAHDIAVSGNYAYIASSHDAQELQVIDVSLRSAPTLLGGYDLGGSSENATAVAVNDIHVYLGIGSVLYVLDDSMHGSPVLQASLSQDGIVNDIAIMTGTDNVCIASSYGSGEFRLVDVATPTSPVLLSALDLASEAHGVAYNSLHDVMVVANASDTGEVMTIHQP